MGEASSRGTKEQRVTAAKAHVAEVRAARDALMELREIERAKAWAKLSPEERQARLDRAMREAEAYGQLSGVFGHDVASVLTTGVLTTIK